jgi:hypothetical protein
MKDRAREPYVPSLLSPIVLLAFLDDPLPLSLKLIRSLPHIARTRLRYAFN